MRLQTMVPRHLRKGARPRSSRVSAAAATLCARGPEDAKVHHACVDLPLREAWRQAARTRMATLCLGLSSERAGGASALWRHLRASPIFEPQVM